MEVTDSQGRKTRIAYDLMNREIRRIERDGGCSAPSTTATARWCG